MKRALLYGALLTLIAVFGTQIYRLYRQEQSLWREAEEQAKQLESLQSDNEALAEDIEYYARPRNLLKEFKGLFNAREAGETFYVIVPPRRESAP